MTIRKINPALLQSPSSSWKPSCSRPARVDSGNTADSLVLGKRASPWLASMLSREVQRRRESVRPETTEGPYILNAWVKIQGYATDCAVLNETCLDPWRNFWEYGRANAALPIRLLLCGGLDDCIYDLCEAFNNALRAVAMEGLRQQSIEGTVPIYTLEYKHVSDHDVTSIRELVRSVFERAQRAPAAIIHVDDFTVCDESEKLQKVTEACILQIREELAQVGDSPRLAICSTTHNASADYLDFSAFSTHHLRPIKAEEVADIVQQYVNVEEVGTLEYFAMRVFQHGMKRRNIKMMSKRAAGIARARLEGQDITIPILTKVSALKQDLLAALAAQEATVRAEEDWYAKNAGRLDHTC